MFQPDFYTQFGSPFGVRPWPPSLRSAWQCPPFHFFLCLRADLEPAPSLPRFEPLFPAQCEPPTPAAAAAMFGPPPPAVSLALKPPGSMTAESGRLPGTVKVQLDNLELWKQFSSVGTEMIITKSGRRMFPQCKITISGLDPNSKYLLLMDVVPVDSSRYRCRAPSARPHLHSPRLAGVREPLDEPQRVLPPGQADQQHIILHSLHRYKARFHVVQASDLYSRRWGGHSSFSFPETTFVTVTAYQNEKVTQLKIQSNPFAKGFREHGMNSKKEREARLKRKTKTPESDTETESLFDPVCKQMSRGDPCDSTGILDPPVLPTLGLSDLPPTDSYTSAPGAAGTLDLLTTGAEQPYVSPQPTDINAGFLDVQSAETTNLLTGLTGLTWLYLKCDLPADQSGQPGLGTTVNWRSSD
uniref:T-box transcription factor TBX6 n=1 Tax=Erpetoichthys calabaricus TaxID=27687 RepID=A0A8C4TM98_ERPCA